MSGNILLGVLGGGLVVYGLMARGKTRPSDDPSLAHLVDVPDPTSRTDGNLALVIGAIFLLGAVFA